MTADVVNLRQARKTKTRAVHAAEGDANRAKHGRTRHERELVTREAEIVARRLDGHRLAEANGRDDGDFA